MMQYLKHILIKVYITAYERIFEKRLKYLFVGNHSDTLVVVFSGFSETPRYNYVRTLKQFKCDKLFLLDDFAYHGSYYWYANGKDVPERLVKSLVSRIINRGGYKKVITVGSSKGGTCAIYYGLKLGATDIYAAACQYHIGKYLNTDDHEKIFKGMMGDNAGEKEQAMLDRKIPSLLKEKHESCCTIHLMYSIDEHTYDDHIKDMIKDMDGYGIRHIDTIKTFSNHAEVGRFFSPWIKEELTRTLIK